MPFVARGAPARRWLSAHFVGHILVELLLDAELIAREPARLDAYYTAIERLDPARVAQAVASIAGRNVQDLSHFIPLFSRERFLSDYADDAKLLFRLNQVMRRVGLPLLPREIAGLLAVAREKVSRQAQALLAA